MNELRSLEPRLNALKLRLRRFAAERDGDRFHSPKNLAMTLIAEAAALAENFQWLTHEESASLPPEKLKEVEFELADISIYLRVDVPERAGTIIALN